MSYKLEHLFNSPSLSQPSDNKYLWRFIKPDRIDSFLNGEIYFSQLLDFQDYYEAITPIHYLILSFFRRNYKVEIPKKNGKVVDWGNMLRKAYLGLEMTMLIQQLKQIFNEANEDELNKKFLESVENIEAINSKHIDTQKRIHASCWFIGDRSESALMWQSYSEPQGIAVRILFKDFKQALERCFKVEERYESEEEIKRVEAGMIKYIDYRTDLNWLVADEKYHPFYKNISFQGEKEYRVVIERYNSTINSFKKLKTPFGFNLDRFEVILHPSASLDDYDKLEKKLDKIVFKPRISFSELSYRLR